MRVPKSETKISFCSFIWNTSSMPAYKEVYTGIRQTLTKPPLHDMMEGAYNYLFPPISFACKIVQKIIFDNHVQQLQTQIQIQVPF